IQEYQSHFPVKDDLQVPLLTLAYQVMARHGLYTPAEEYARQHMRLYHSLIRCLREQPQDPPRSQASLASPPEPLPAHAVPTVVSATRPPREAEGQPRASSAKVLVALDAHRILPPKQVKDLRRRFRNAPRDLQALLQELQSRHGLTEFQIQKILA